MWLALQSNVVNTLFRRTGREDVLHSGVWGEHLTHELLLLLPEVVLQVVCQHHISGLLHGHHLAEHLQLGKHRRQREKRERMTEQQKTFKLNQGNKDVCCIFPASLQLPEYSQRWYLWVCVCLRGLFRCQAEAKRQRRSIFGSLQCARVKPRHPCFSHASPGTHTNTNTNAHTEYKCSRSYDLSRTTLFSSIIDHH